MIFTVMFEQKNVGERNQQLHAVMGILNGIMGT